MWTNVLAPSKQGEKLSDEQIAKETKEKFEEEQALLSYCMAVSEKIDKLRSNQKLTMAKKAGSTGQLFGTITKKNILEILTKQAIGIEKIDEKYVSIISIQLDQQKDELEEIRKTGVYTIKVQLHPKVISSFELEVTNEK